MKYFNTLLVMNVAMCLLSAITGIGWLFKGDWLTGLFALTGFVCWLIGTICIIKDIKNNER
jgi:hypothetical protein